MSIIIGADIVPTKSNQRQFIEGKIDEIIDHELSKILSDSDYRIINLETPLCIEGEPIKKCGPNFANDPRSISVLNKMHIDLVTLANNHIMDQGNMGLANTIAALQNAGISYVGAGKNIIDASKPFFFTVHGVQYGVYACAEHEFSIAEETKPGANPFEPLESYDHIISMKKQCEYSIVLFHGGKEYYRYPSPTLQKNCRKFVEKGANLVICQHSHCIGCKEEYLNGTIIYGQGNFIFDGKNDEFWNSSMLICINDELDIQYIPILKKQGHVSLASNQDRKNIMDCFLQRSEEIKSNQRIKEKYSSYCRENIDDYIIHIIGIEKNLIYKIINKLTKQKLKKLLAQRYICRNGLYLRNCIECEAHRELLLHALREKQ